MEKILTTEERIRRAEEIYERRRDSQARMRTETINIEKKKNMKLFKKLLLQILACSMIYYLLFWMQATSYFPYTENIAKVKEALSSDMDFQAIYQSMQKQWLTWQKEEKQEESQENQSLQEATLSATEELEKETEGNEEKELSQMELDAKEIQDQYSLIKPIEGQVTSGFGQREATSSIVSTNHSGIDIAAMEGTKIKAAMEGAVTIAAQSNTYRKLY